MASLRRAKDKRKLLENITEAQEDSQLLRELTRDVANQFLPLNKNRLSADNGMIEKADHELADAVKRMESRLNRQDKDPEVRVRRGIFDFLLGKPAKVDHNTKAKLHRRNTILYEQSKNLKASKKHSQQTKSIEKKLKKYDISSLNVMYNGEQLGQNENLFCIVVPSGHGKSHACGKYGWIDVDSCVSTRYHDDLWEDRVDSLIKTDDWCLSQAKWLERVATTINLMSINTPTVMLVHDYAAVQTVGGTYAGTVMLRDHHNSKAYKERSPAARNFMDMNAAITVTYPDARFCETYDEVDLEINRIVHSLGIPIAIPAKIGITQCDYFDRVSQYGTGNIADIDYMISLEQAGLIPKCAVDYQVRLRSKSAYRGYGKCMNDWAKVFSRMEIRENGTRAVGRRVSYKDLSTMDVKELCKHLVISDDEDVQMLIGMHLDDSIPFVVNLLLHWKVLGLSTSVADIIFKMSCVREANWDMMMDGILSTLSQSEDIMGCYLTTADRDVLLGMRYISCQDRAAFATKLLKPVSQPVRNVKAASVGRVVNACSLVDMVPNRLIICDSDLVNTIKGMHVCPELNKLLDKIPSMSVDDLAGLAENSAEFPTKIRLLAMLICTLPEDWRVAGHTETIIARSIQKSIAHVQFDLSSRSVLRDEWSEAIKGLIRDRFVDEKIIMAVYNMMVSDFSGSTADKDWDAKMFDSVRSLFAAGMCAESLGKQVRLIGQTTLLPIVWDCDQAEVMRAMIRLGLPKHVSRAYGDEYNEAVYLSQKMVEASRDQSVTLLCAVNAEKLLGIDRPELLYAVLGQLTNNMYIDDRVSDMLFSLMFKRWFKRLPTDDDKKQVRRISFSKTRDGGLGGVTQSGFAYSLVNRLRNTTVAPGSLRKAPGDLVSIDYRQAIHVKNKVKIRANYSSTDRVQAVLDFHTMASRVEKKDESKRPASTLLRLGILNFCIIEEVEQKMAWRLGPRQAKDKIEAVVDTLATI